MTRPKVMQLSLLLVFALACGAVSVVVMWQLGTAFRDAVRAKSWAVLPAEVQLVRYAYRVAGREYASTRLGIAQINGAEGVGCHNRVALVSNTVKGAAPGTNFHVRAPLRPPTSRYGRYYSALACGTFTPTQPKTQTPQSWKRPSGLFHDWFLGQSSSRKKALLTVRKERFLAVVHT